MGGNWIRKETNSCGGFVMALAAVLFSCLVIGVTGQDGQAMTAEEKSKIR